MSDKELKREEMQENEAIQQESDVNEIVDLITKLKPEDKKFVHGICIGLGQQVDLEKKGA